MAEKQVLEFQKLPSLTALYGRALLGRRAGGELPPIEARARGLVFEPTRLAAYRKVCGFQRDGVPLTYPQVFATPLHAAIVAHPSFPFPSAGLVHVRNVLRQHRALEPGDTFDIECSVEGSREARLGHEFDLHTRVTVGSGLAWESTVTALSRTPTKPADRPRDPAAQKDPPGEPPGTFRSVIWQVPADAGRRYARVSGDYNPIHLTAITAKLFGFPRAIATGMWTFAKCVASLEDVAEFHRVQASVQFRRPVLLPSTVFFSAQRAGPDLAFAVRGRGLPGSVHLSGSIGALP